MLRFQHHIAPSRIPMAGKGLFTKEAVNRGRVLIIPNQRHQLYSARELAGFASDSIEMISSLRWFEDVHTIDPEWSEESHLNHSFNPNCLWHLGFVFALVDINPDDELTIDYGHLLDEHTVLDFRDSLTGREIRGLKWEEKMLRTAGQLQQLFGPSRF
jgi:hypothetical protein